MEENIIVSNVTKQYKGGVTALADVSFTAGDGVFGLLGHNGAGKSTLMQAIVTVEPPTAGTIRVCGFDSARQGKAVRRHIGYLPQSLPMYPNLTVWDFVSYMGALKGIRDKKQVEQVLAQVDMLEFAKRKIDRLSGGMRRRVGIAQALLGEPRVLVVDEPTAGLDPEERVRFRGVLSQYAQHGRTVLLSTHIVEDIHQLCENLAVLRKGGLFYSGSSQDLLRRVEGKVKLIHLADEAELAALQRRAIVLTTTYEQKGIQARIVDEENAFRAASVPATLEDAYVYCMGGKSHA